MLNKRLRQENFTVPTNVSDPFMWSGQLLEKCSGSRHDRDDDVSARAHRYSRDFASSGDVAILRAQKRKRYSEELAGFGNDRRFHAARDASRVRRHDTRSVQVRLRFTSVEHEDD